MCYYPYGICHQEGMGSRDAEIILTTHKTSKNRVGTGSITGKLAVTTHGRYRSKREWVVRTGN